MARSPRRMRLTADHVALVHSGQPIEDDANPPEGMVKSTDEDYAETIARLLATGPDPADMWFFAYGSLIWKPACGFVEIRTGLVRGWHRAFCLGWNTRFRGSEENPGLMLALDNGGACKGVAYRLPPHEVEANLKKLLEREMGWKPSAFPPRWVDVVTSECRIRALTFCIDRRSPRYISGLSEEQVASVLARAVGARGSMAEYLLHTITHLEEMGIHDPHLWRLQEYVAAQIEAELGPLAEPAPRAVSDRG
ncbi:MAG TPA: gamma-glutamylcyclotransferase [Devosiaceae bacterium]|nr:gamma-glutamylcyclotransferase [Devosiaceae bacterium]